MSEAFLTTLEELSVAALVVVAVSYIVVQLLRYVSNHTNLSSNQIKALMELLTKTWHDMNHTLKELQNVLMALKATIEVTNNAILDELKQQKAALERLETKVEKVLSYYNKGSED